MGDCSGRVCVVTGSNKGIGLEIVRELSKKGITVVLTARDVNKGKAAVDKLLKDEGLEVLFHQLDVTDDGSIAELAAWLKQHLGGLDILVGTHCIPSPWWSEQVNNAGVSSAVVPSKLDLARAKTVLNTNYYGAKKMMEAMVPIMKHSKEGARIVNVSSMASQLTILQGEASAWREALSDDENLTEDVIESFIQSFLKDLNDGQLINHGWPAFPPIEGLPADDGADYCVSKMALNAYSRIMAREFAKRNGISLYINCMCPGVTSTDMAFHRGHSAAVGADTAVWLALHPAADCPSGKFFVRREDVGFLQIPLALHGASLWETPPEVLDVYRDWARMIRSSTS